MSMTQITCTLVGVSPLGFNAAVQSKKKTGEGHDVFEERTWRERMHTNGDGKVFLLPSAIKNCLISVAKYLSESVPGKGKATYTKHFKSGVQAQEPLLLNVKAKDINGVKIHVPSDGKPGGGTRVWKTFPTLDTWETKITLIINDPIIKPELVERYLQAAGIFIGLGTYRPQNGGHQGRFTVKDFKSETI